MNSVIMLVCVMIAMFVIILIISYICRTLQAENQKLKTELIQKENNIAFLVTHMEEITKIKKDGDQVEEEIKNAKNENELFQIVNRHLVAANNRRVRK